MSNETNALDDKSTQTCEKSDCGKEGCEKCREEVTPEAKSMEDCMGKSMEMLANTFSASAKRWEMIVYPSLFAFILLAGYGFYLIYNLTEDAHQMAKNMQDISNNMIVVSESMIAVSQNTNRQTAAMQDIVVNMQNMNVSMNQMRHDMSVMNYNVSRPMSKINKFIPW